MGFTCTPSSTERAKSPKPLEHGSESRGRGFMGRIGSKGSYKGVRAQSRLRARIFRAVPQQPKKTKVSFCSTREPPKPRRVLLIVATRLLMLETRNQENTLLALLEGGRLLNTLNPKP